MRKNYWSLVLLLIVALVAWWWGRPKTANEAASAPIPTPPTTQKVNQTKAAGPAVPTLITSPTQLQAEPLAASLPSQFVRIEAPPPPPVVVPGSYVADTKPNPVAQEMEEISLNIRNFSLRFGGNPVGTNAEIIKALNGGNEAHVNYLPASKRINGNGELMDAWGTPYFFHANSATELEVRSAGPDRKLYTSDDLTAR
jgi:hypothetical protein